MDLRMLESEERLAATHLRQTRDLMGRGKQVRVHVGTPTLEDVTIKRVGNP